MFTLRYLLVGLLYLLWCPLMTAAAQTRPNILWIVAEDASPHIGCYGETTIATPALDRLAAQGVRFTNAFVTCPVCSPSRSAMVTGIYQTTLGAHNHRSQSASGKAGGNEAYYDSYRLPIPSIPRLFRDAGYYTVNAGTAKTDYNFLVSRDQYDGEDWTRRERDQPFFAQVQLRGGKNRRAKQHSTDAAEVELPPYYPNHPVLREDWASYLNAWVQVDQEVDAILQELDDEGVAGKTVVFFWTDHGVSHLRGKQFLYEEGIRVPLLVRFPDGRAAGQTRADLAVHIDVAATSLALAGIEIPPQVQGLDLFAEDYQPRQYVFAARDRCDETVDIIRCVRTPRYKYIRNFLPHLPHAQPNQYKDGKKIVQTMRQLHTQGQLNALQARPFLPHRPAEELYDLLADPHETVNLVAQPQHLSTLEQLRRALHDWMIASRDVGLIPEPILEELGRRYGNKHHVLQAAENARLNAQLLGIIEAGEAGDQARLLAGLDHDHPAIRYWAATGLGLRGRPRDVPALEARLNDSSPGVRVAVALALCRLGHADSYAATLAKLIEAPNRLVGMYAIRGLELIGADARTQLPAILAANQSDYEFTRRIARRLSDRLAR